MLAVPPLVWALLTGHFGWALGLAVFAGLSDLADGWLARRFSWQSLWGSVFDPLADKFLMVASYVTLGWLGELDRKSTRLNSSHVAISYAVLCLKKKKY